MVGLHGYIHNTLSQHVVGDYMVGLHGYNNINTSSLDVIIQKNS